MKINETIRKFRKSQNLTQEQVANYLGVSAPAVNKWENGISYPDITLLAPLARLLKTDVDTLLSFREELTELEIGKIINSIPADIMKDGYRKTFEKTAALIQEYPNCDKLVLFAAQTLTMYLSIQPEDEKERYEKQILAWFETIVMSDEKELSNMAAFALCQNYIQNGEFDAAQKLLDKIPPLGLDKRNIQAGLYASQEKYDEAFRIIEGMLYQNVSGSVNCLIQMVQWLCRQKEYDQASIFADLARELAEKFDLSQYIAGSAQLLIMLEKKDKENSIRTLETMMHHMDMDCTKESSLYKHMQFSKGNGLKGMKEIIRKSFEQDKELDFLREEPGFKRILKELSSEE